MLDCDKERWNRIIERLKATSKEIDTLTSTMLEEDMEDTDCWYIIDNLRWASREAFDVVDYIEGALAMNEGPDAFKAYVNQTSGSNT